MWLTVFTFNFISLLLFLFIFILAFHCKVISAFIYLHIIYFPVNHHSHACFYSQIHPFSLSSTFLYCTLSFFVPLYYFISIPISTFSHLLFFIYHMFTFDLFILAFAFASMYSTWAQHLHILFVSSSSHLSIFLSKHLHIIFLYFSVCTLFLFIFLQNYPIQYCYFSRQYFSS